MIKYINENKICLSIEGELDCNALALTLEPLYLSRSNTFEFLFDRSYLNQVERVFDVLIQKHGIRDVEFSFILEDGKDRANFLS